jgi:signal peptidase I
LRGYKLKNFGLNALDILLNVLVIVVLVYFVRSYIISPFQVYGPSMCNTLNYLNQKCVNEYGEYIIVNKAGYLNFIGEPQRGDVVVFTPPNGSNEYYIKRIVGIPGDTVELKAGNVYIKNEENPEGYKLNESYLSTTNFGNTASFGETVFNVPTDHYLVFGDNRAKSTDSRSCFRDPYSGGCKSNGATPYLAKDMIEGKAWVVLWPFSKIRLVD